MSTQSNLIKKAMDTRKMVTMSMLCAIGIVLVSFFEVPIIPAAPFLKYDPADVPILIGTLIYGPAAGIIMTVIVSFIQSFMMHGSGGVIGFIMHIIATGAMAFAAGMIYRRGNRTLFSAAIALTAGTVAMTVAMIGMNLVLTPIFMSVPVSVVKDMLIPAIIPFNVVKAGLNSAAAFGLFKVVEKIARK